MDKYKKILFLLFTSMIPLGVFSQLNLGVKGGMNISSIDEYHTPDGSLFNLKSHVSFHAGILAQYMFNNSLGIESGLYYSMLGGREEKTESGIKYTTTANPSYLQLPVVAIYKFEVGDEIYVYPSGGIYLGYGLGGNIKTENKTDGGNSKVDFFHNDVHRFDMGVSIGVNVEYKSFLISLGLDQGLLKLNKDREWYNKNAYNQNFKISVGYILGEW